MFRFYFVLVLFFLFSVKALLCSFSSNVIFFPSYYFVNLKCCSEISAAIRNDSSVMKWFLSFVQVLPNLHSHTNHTYKHKHKHTHRQKMCTDGLWPQIDFRWISKVIHWLMIWANSSFKHLAQTVGYRCI